MINEERMIDLTVGSYRIVSKLGAGGMGAVWLAEHALLGRRVAIKFLHAEVSQSPAIVERFFAEARAASRIADPGIVVVYDFGWHTDSRAYIVMEHLAGESLAARLEHGPVAVEAAVHMMEQAAMAMAVAHARGIIHRDLKPDNIFLVPDPVAPGGERVKLLDFGIAKLVGDDHGTPTRTRTGLIMGTPTYMSPEQCRGAGDIDHRTDIYALGCVLFHLLCGRPPFFASTPGDLIAAHLRETPEPPSTLVPAIPKALDDVVMRCLAKAAGDRYASMTELVRDLRAAIGSTSIVPTIAPLRAPPRPPVETVYSQGPQLSTFANGAGESLVHPPRSRRPGLLLAGVVMMAAVIALVVARSQPSPEAPAVVDAASSLAPAVAYDAAPATDAPVVVDATRDALPDATPDARPAKTKRRPSFDPFDDR